MDLKSMTSGSMYPAGALAGVIAFGVFPPICDGF
jgi:hypothetical protein